MTLVQILADEKSVHMACDFRLTDPFTKQAKTNQAYKLVSANTKNGSALVGVTGIAFIDGKPIGDWIARAVGPFRIQASIEGIYDALRQIEIPLARLQGRQDARLTFAVGALMGSQSVITLVSNFEKFIDGRIVRSDTAARAMSVTSIRPKGAVFFATGDVASIKPSERNKLTLLLRSGASDNQIHEQMRLMNEAVSQRTPTVSSGCQTASLHATGAGSGKPFLTDEQPGDFIPPEFSLMMENAGLRLNRSIGPDGKPNPIRVVQSASAHAGASYEYFREQLKLRPESAEIWNNYGSYLAARGRNADARAAFEKAHRIDPSYTTATSNLASQAWRQMDIAKATALFEEAIAGEEPSAPSWLLSNFASFCDEVLSDTNRAAALYSRIAQDQNYQLGPVQQAVFMLKHGIEQPKARAIIAAAVEKHPNDVQILCLAARAEFFYLGDNEAALQKLHKACTLAPNDRYVLRLAADVCLSAGDSYSAAYYYRKVIKKHDGDAESRGNYGLALLMEGKVDGALRQLNKASHLDSENPAIQTNLAAALWASGKHADATTLIRKIITSSPSPGIVLEAMAMLYVAASSERRETALRIRELIDLGARANGDTIRCMIREMTGSDREIGEQIVGAVEGKNALPENL